MGSRWGGLRLRILAWSFIPTVIILVAVAVLIYFAYQDVTGDLVLGRNRELTRLAAGRIADELEGYARTLDAVARSQAIASGYSNIQQEGLSEASSSLAIFDGGVVLLSPYGRVVATEPPRPEIEGQIWWSRSYVQSALRPDLVEVGGPVFSDLVLDGPDGEPAIAVVMPIHSPQGTLVGGLVGLFLVGPTVNNSLYGDLVRLRLGEGGSAFVVDANGRVLYHTAVDLIGGDASALPDVQQAARSGAGAMRTIDSAGQDIVASYAPIPGTSWAVVEHQSWSGLMAASQGYRRWLLVLLGLGVLIPAVVVTVGVRRIARPINEMIGAAQKVAEGDFSQSITARTGDEIEQLAGQFSQMAAELKQSYAKLEVRAEARARELAALNAIAAVVSQSSELSVVLSQALRQTLAVVGLEAGGIYLLDEEADLLTIATYEGISPQFAAEIDRLKVGEGFSGRVAESGQPLVVADVSSDPRLTRMVVREEAVHSLAIVPLSSKGTVLGTLFAMTHGFREFTEQDLQLLTSIGQQIGIAVENARLLSQARQRMQQTESLYRSEQRRADQFRVISEVGYHMTSILPVGQLLDKIARSIQQAFGYYHVGIGLIEGDEVVYRFGAGALWDDPRFEFKPARLRVGSEGLSGWAAATGQPVMVPDVNQDSRYVWLHGSRTQSELIVPITVKGQRFGLLDVQSDQLNAFDESDAVVLQALAHQAGVAIENARLYEQAQQVAVMEERNRLARDLHDAVTQTLFSASLIAEAVPDVWQSDPVEAGELLRELRRLSRGALAEMRTLLLELRPGALVETSVADLLYQLTEAISGRSGLTFTLDVQHDCFLPSDAHVALYRIAQEALNNIVKHAQAHHASVVFRCTTSPGADGTEETALAELRVQDDGRGFDPSRVLPRHLGLHIMRERAEAIGARLTVESEAGHGTRIAVVWTKDPSLPTREGQG